MITRTLKKIMLITLLSVIGLYAKPMELASVTPPRPVGGFQTVQDRAQYPVQALESRFESNVLLSFRVEKTGTVSHIKIIESGGSHFDKSAINAVMRTEWIPASHNNQNVPIRFELPFKFNVE
ncbi:MAG: energy transducer TonB [Candidatus Marinimicrobia bacterium]|nr:energy transducer TonB [Candidatus Neomarinimicrobiota bacterium]